MALNALELEDQLSTIPHSVNSTQRLTVSNTGKMDDDKTLRRTHPQKYYLKYICKWLYYFGAGDCWYEESTPLPAYKRILYDCWKSIARFYLCVGLFNEYCGYFRTNRSEADNNDLLQFCMAHSALTGKIIMLILQKDRIKMILERFLESDKRVSMLKIEEVSVKKALKYCIAIFVGSYMTLIATLVDRVTQHYRDGIPFRVEVTLYPKSNDTLTSWILRFLVEFHWYFLVGFMFLADSLTMCCLTFLATRFELLQKYFEGLKENFLRNPKGKTQDELEEEYLEAVIEGIKKHEHTLWCTRRVQYALGNLYSLQLVEGTSLLAMCLIKLVRNERNLTFLMANFAYIGVMLILNGVYMIPGGDITWEASQVQLAIFDSGWEQVRRRSRKLRPVVVVALIRSQVPVEMTAFGIFVLSYGNFISVLRMSYSFFAVMY